MSSKFTEVRLDEFVFALPIWIEINANFQLQPKIEIPSEFFGLEPVVQLGVIEVAMKGVSNAIAGFSDATDNTSAITHSDFTLELKKVAKEEQISKMLCGVRISIKKIPKTTIECDFDFGEKWNVLSSAIKREVLKAIYFLLQNAGISIFNREEAKASASH